MNSLIDFILAESLVEFYIADADTLRFITVNRAAVDNTGYSEEELTGATALLVMPQHTPQSLQEVVSPLRSRASHKAVQFSNVHTRKDGTTYPVDVHLQLAEYQGREAFFILVSDATQKQLQLDQLRQVIRGAQLGYWDFNNATGLYFVDDKWLGMLGLARGDVDIHDRTDWFRLIHPDDREWLLEEVGRVARTNGSYILEFRMLHKDGRVVWIQSAGAVVEWDHQVDRARRLSGTHLDITERKRSEQEREQYHQFFTIADDLMAMTDAQGRFLRANPAWERVLGYTEDELRGKQYFDLLHADDIEAGKRELPRVLRKGFTRNFENRYRCKDGSYRWLSWNARYDAANGVTYATARDVTETKAAEQSLRSQEEIYRSLMENSEDLVILFDRDHRYQYVNPAVERYLGFEKGELIGKTRADLHYPKELRELWYETIEKVFTTGEAQKRFYDIDTVRGTAHIDWHAFPGMRDEHGRVTRVFSVSRDVTQWHKVEQELQKMQRLNSVGVLAGGIAHDFNNILTILFGNIAMARTQADDPQAMLESLDKAEAAFHRASNLTSQLLTFAKGGDPVKRNISLSDLVRETVNFDLSGSNVNLVLKADEGLWTVQADRGQITQVFSNLTINADQAMPNGGTLTIVLANAEVGDDDIPGLAAGRYIKACVCDEGTGMDEDELDRVFDPFYSTKQGGSGLGLATVYSIIKKHGGQINVTSTPGRGSAFCFYLPASEHGEAAGDEDKPAAQDEPHNGQRILVMDDEPMIRDLAAKILAKEGFRVDSAADGDQAVAMVREAMAAGSPYDCLVMDLTIPGGMGGKEAVKQVLAQDPQARVIVSSGYGVDPVMANYADYGFKGVISKPFTGQELIGEIRRLLGPAAS